MAGLLFFGWYALNFRAVVETPEMTTSRLIQAHPIRVAAKVVQPFDPGARRGRGGTTPQSKYIFEVAGREYSGWFVNSNGTSVVEVTYCSKNPALHCLGSPDGDPGKSSGEFSLGFVIGTGLAFGLGLPLLLVGLKG